MSQDKPEIRRAIEAAQRRIELGRYRPPIDVYRVAQDIGLAVMERDLEDQVSGMLVMKGGKGTIVVNQNHHINRRRFTVAHECGHTELHLEHTDSQVFIDATPVFFRDTISTEGRSLQEIAANTYAAELLMPEEQVRKILREQPIDAFDDIAIRHIAGVFEVSPQALTIRLTRLNLISLG
jgi:Zn-dependent peptidase ImmA (M78 family)